MNLKEFVSKSLEEIVSGVHDAGNRARGYGARVNPKGYEGVGENAKGVYTDENGDYHAVEYVDFDIAVVAEESSGKQGGGEIKVFSVGLGGGASAGSVNRSESRLKFRVPVLFPTSKG